MLDVGPLNIDSAHNSISSVPSAINMSAFLDILSRRSENRRICEKWAIGVSDPLSGVLERVQWPQAAPLRIGNAWWSLKLWRMYMVEQDMKLTLTQYLNYYDTPDEWLARLPEHDRV